MTKKKAANKIRVTLVRSTAGRLPNHKDCVRGLGLRRMRHSVELTATPEVLGLVQKVRDMLKVEEI
jgi:large subunit ribosomal protein L30